MSRSTRNEQHQSQHMKTIHHTKKESGTKGFTQIDNSVLQDPNLSDRARGLLVRMLSRPDDWQFYIGHLEDTGRDSALKIRGALKELKDRGYAKLVPLLKETTMQRNGSTYQVFEDPGMSENQHAGNTARRKTHTTNNDCTKNEEKNSPNPLGESENPIPEDTPSKATGTPLKDFEVKNSRDNTWFDVQDCTPPPGRDAVILRFSRDTWSMALAYLFNVHEISHRQATPFMASITKGEIGVREMLWLLIMEYPRIKRGTKCKLPEILTMAARMHARHENGDLRVSHCEFNEILNSVLLRKGTPQEIYAEYLRVEAVMLNARKTGLAPENMEALQGWACLWAQYVTTLVPEQQAAYDYYQDDLLIRSEYPVDSQEEAGQEDQPEDPAEPATAPASGPDCNPCSEIPDWAYDPQFRPYWQGDLPPRAETTTQDDDDDDDFPAWVLDHHAFNTAKN